MLAEQSIVYITCTLAIAVGLWGITYKALAQQKGWPIGETFRKDANTIQIACFVLVLFAIAKAFYLLHWWSPFPILVVGWLVSCATTFSFMGASLSDQFLVF